MAFLNSVNPLNMGAEPVKTAQNSNSNQDGVNKPSIEFAQTLRKQLQQSLQKAPVSSPPPQSANNKAADAAKEAAASEGQSKVKQAADQPAQNTAAQTEAAQNDTTQQDTGHATTKEVAQQEDGQAGKAVNTEPQVEETAAERKKRILSELSAQNIADSGVSPWMQTMIAMRPASANAAEKGTLSAEKPGQSAIDFPLTASGDASVAMTAEEALQAPVATGVPARLLDTPTETPASASFNEVLNTASSVSANAMDMSGLSETTDLARSVMDAAIEAAMTGKAGQEKGQPFSAEAPTIDALPASQAMPNTPWLNATGSTQTTNVVTTQIATPFGNERWQAAMNQHVMKMVGSGDEVASLTLSPPDLGPIQVVLKVDNQSVNTSFITDNPLVRQALEDGMQDLKDRMQSQGLQLGQTFVGDGRQAQQHFETQGQQASAQMQRGSELEADAATQPVSTPVRAVKLGMVDTFV